LQTVFALKSSAQEEKEEFLPVSKSRFGSPESEWPHSERWSRQSKLLVKKRCKFLRKCMTWTFGISYQRAKSSDDSVRNKQRPYCIRD